MNTYADLEKYTDRWTRRLKVRRAFRWALRGLLSGLTLALLASLLALLQARLLRQELIPAIVGGAVFGLCLFALAGSLWPIRKLEAARYFDRQFGLQERISTAFELAADKNHSATALAEHQLRDAIEASRRVGAAARLPVRIRWPEILLAGVLLLGAVALWRFGEPYFQQAQEHRQVEQTIDEEAADIRELISEIEAWQELTEEQRQALTQPLEEVLEKLELADSPEQAVSALAEAERKLQPLAAPELQQATDTLREIGAEVAQSESGALEDLGQRLESGDFSGAAQNLADLDLPSLNQEELEELAERLADMAQALEEVAPETAQGLQQASQELQEGDLEAAQQSLEGTAQSLQELEESQTLAEGAAGASDQVEQSQAAILGAAAGADGQLAGTAEQGGGQGDQAGGGAGQGDFSQETDPGAEVQPGPISQDNAPGDGGLRPYESIYTPQRLGGEAQVGGALPQSGEQGDQFLGGLDSTPDEASETTVPYVEVLAQYEQVYREALESGEVPPAFRELVRQYFSSLEP